MEISRRIFLKYASSLAGVAALDQTGLLSLKKLSPAEAEAAKEAMGKYQVKYTACAMCPAECGLEMWTQDGSFPKFTATKKCR